MATLFEPYAVTKNVILKNRLSVCPMGFTKDLDGGISQRQADYLVERAKGGFGLIYPSAHVISAVCETPGEGGSNFLTNTHHAERIGFLADRIHRYGVKLALQFSPGLGRVNTAHPSVCEYISASEVPAFHWPKTMCRPMTVEEIRQILKDTTRAARFARNAGVDIIEIHAYGGYLLDQFLTPLWNKRTDQYGGSLENRMRFIVETYEAIRKVVGPDYPIAIKYTPDHGFEGGRTLEGEGIEIAKILDEMGFAYIHLDHGAYETWHKAVTTSYEPARCQMFLAERLREAGIRTPFFVQGKLNNPVDAEQAVSSGVAQIVGLGHQSIADPYWPLKVKRGQYEDIIHCIGCNECIYTAGMNTPRTCALNPATGFESEIQPIVADVKRKLLVIGAGPAGMYAATVAARAGHDVTLWEKTDKLGGLLNAAGAPACKFDIKIYNEHLKTQLYKSGARIQFCKEATVENVMEFAPDAVLVAAGCHNIKPPIPGIDGEHVYDSVEALLNNLNVGRKAVIIGGGPVGCDLALDLCDKGKDVTIVEMLPKLLKNAKDAANVEQAILNRLKLAGVRSEVGVKVTEILPDHIKGVKADGTEIEIECDSVYYAVGFKSDHSLADELSAKGLTVVPLGDYIKPHKVIQAVHTAYHAVQLIEHHIGYNR